MAWRYGIKSVFLDDFFKKPYNTTSLNSSSFPYPSFMSNRLKTFLACSATSPCFTLHSSSRSSTAMGTNPKRRFLLSICASVHLRAVYDHFHSLARHLLHLPAFDDLRRLRNNIKILKFLVISIIVNRSSPSSSFNLVPFVFGIAPKTNLFIFSIVFALIEIAWRRLFNRAASAGEAPNRVLLSAVRAEEIEKTVRANAQLGYEIKARMDGGIQHYCPPESLAPELPVA